MRWVIKEQPVFHLSLVSIIAYIYIYIFLNLTARLFFFSCFIVLNGSMGL